MAERIADILTDGMERTQAEIRAELADPDGESLSESTVRYALTRNLGPNKRFTVARSVRGQVYSLRLD